ncbi:MAG: hypothetical protein U0527_01700 [Candidatus Eisenbacteria bacterium]
MRARRDRDPSCSLGALFPYLAVALLLGLAASTALAGALASPWSFRGAVGTELDLTAERFGLGCASDFYLDPLGDLLEEGTSLRYRQEETRGSGVLELGLDRGGDRWVRATARLKASDGRARGTGDAGAGIVTRYGSLSLEDALELEDRAPFGYRANRASLVLETPRFGPQARLRAHISEDRSSPVADSLRALFAYRVLRPECSLTSSLLGGDVMLLVGSAQKRGDDDTTSYRARRWSLEWERAALSGREIRAVLRQEVRRPLAVDSLSPGHLETEAELEGSWPIAPAFALTGQGEWANDQYSIDSSIYADHWTGRGEFGVEWNRTAPETGADGTWSLALALRHELLRHEQRDGRDSRSWSIALDASRSSSLGPWFEPSIEVGRRRYRDSADCRQLSLEGIDLSTSNSDYRFLRSSLLGETPLFASTRLTLFAQYERELHDRAEDDLTLWILNASILLSF